MGLHNLESESVFDIVEASVSSTETSQVLQVVETFLDQYGAIPNAPLSTQAEMLRHLMTFTRNMRYSLARRTAMKKLERLNQVLEQNRDKRLGIFIEYVDMPSFEATLGRYTVWKGTLFDVPLEQTVVCWHPDKDFKPAEAIHIHRTQYSQLGRRRRYRQTKSKTS